LVLFVAWLRAGDIGSATVFAQHVIERLDDEPLQRLTQFDRQQLERLPPAFAQTGLHIAELHALRPWKPGESGNPAGRPIGARQKISEALLADLHVVWEEHGVSVLQRLAVTDPGKLAQIAYGLLPRDVFISVEQRTPGNLDPDEWAILRRVIDLIKQNANGSELGLVLETIENALRADQTKMIESE